MVIPAIFVSAYIGYIFAAWLTEPSKTTMYLFALSIVLYLIIISGLVYNKVSSLIFNYTEDERIFLIITFITVFLEYLLWH